MQTVNFPFAAGIPSAPGKVPKYVSNERFSCMITTTCWILPPDTLLEGEGGDVGPAPGGGDVGPAPGADVPGGAVDRGAFDDPPLHATSAAARPMTAIRAPRLGIRHLTSVQRHTVGREIGRGVAVDEPLASRPRRERGHGAARDGERKGFVEPGAERA